MPALPKMEFNIRLNYSVPSYRITHDEYGNRTQMTKDTHRIDIENLLEKQFHTCDMGYYHICGFEQLTREKFSNILKNMDPILKKTIHAYSFSDLRRKMDARVNKITIYMAERTYGQFKNIHYKEFLNEKDITQYIKN